MQSEGAGGRLETNTGSKAAGLKWGDVLDPLMTSNQQSWPGMKNLQSEPTPRKYR